MISGFTDFVNPEGALAWIEGEFDECRDNPHGNYLFAHVNFSTAVATPLSCIQRNETLHEEEWLASFSVDGSLWAHASGGKQLSLF